MVKPQYRTARSTQFEWVSLKNPRHATLRYVLAKVKFVFVKIAIGCIYTCKCVCEIDFKILKSKLSL